MRTQLPKNADSEDNHLKQKADRRAHPIYYDFNKHFHDLDGEQQPDMTMSDEEEDAEYCDENVLVP
jgi:hypothetical protein